MSPYFHTTNIKFGKEERMLSLINTIGYRNKVKKCTMFRGPNAFNLSQSFKLRELRISIQVIYPFSLVHSLTYGLQIFFNAYYVSLNGQLSVEMDNLMSEGTNFVSIPLYYSIFLFYNDLNIVV